LTLFTRTFALASAVLPVIHPPQPNPTIANANAPPAAPHRAGFVWMGMFMTVLSTNVPRCRDCLPGFRSFETKDGPPRRLSAGAHSREVRQRTDGREASRKGASEAKHDAIVRVRSPRDPWPSSD